MPIITRIPYTDPLPPPRIIPSSATTVPTAVTALARFLSASAIKSSKIKNRAAAAAGKTVLLTGAGLSVASGLADYRGANGTYTLNKSYRPIYHHEFVTSHEARVRYWARSFMGWRGFDASKPNVGHGAIKRLGEMGMVSGVITQNVDSFHRVAHPELPTLELHGYLRSVVCITCHKEYPRIKFQKSLSTLNPGWDRYLEEKLAEGTLRTNPDGDVDMGGKDYRAFRYPACPNCVAHPPKSETGKAKLAKVDEDGAGLPESTVGILKPGVVMFGESIPAHIKTKAEEMIDEACRILVVGSTLATYSAWRLVKRAKEGGLGIGILNIGGARGEEQFLEDVVPENEGLEAVRVSQSSDVVLPQVVEALEKMEVNFDSGLRTPRYEGLRVNS